MVCGVVEGTERLSQQLRELSGSKCILYIVDPHAVHERLAVHNAFPHEEEDREDDTQSLHDFLEELAEV